MTKTSNRKCIYLGVKQLSKCGNCFTTNTDLLEFAHFDRHKKNIKLNKPGGWSNLNKVEMLHELTLGRFLCRKCHIDETINENRLIQRNKVCVGATKGCSKCKEDLDLSRFHKNKTKKSGYDSNCVDCKYKRQQSKKEYILSRKKERGRCVSCLLPVDDPENFEFDHFEKKRKNVGSMLQYSIRSIDSEISKCELRCIPCHRKITEARRLGEEVNTCFQNMVISSKSGNMSNLAQESSP